MLNLYGSVYTKDIAYLVNYITYTAKNYLRIWFCLYAEWSTVREGAFQTGTWLCIIWYHRCDVFFIFIFFFSFFSSFGRWKKKTKAKAGVDGSAAGKTIYKKTKANQEDQNSNIALLKKHSYKIGHLLITTVTDKVVSVTILYYSQLVILSAWD